MAAFISPWVPPAWLDDASPRTQLDVESVGIAISLYFKLARLARTLAAYFAYLPSLEFLFMNSWCSGSLAKVLAHYMISPSILSEDVDPAIFPALLSQNRITNISTLCISHRVNCIVEVGPCLKDFALLSCRWCRFGDT